MIYIYETVRERERASLVLHIVLKQGERERERELAWYYLIDIHVVGARGIVGYMTLYFIFA
jgi:hypothetical protein